MRLTISRWISCALVSLSILVVSSLFVVGERGDSGSFDTYEHIPPVLAMRDRARSGALLTAVREHIELSTRESWEHASRMAPKAGLVFDERLPASLRVKIASALAPQLEVLASDSIAARVALFVHFDTTSLESWAAPLEASGRSYGRAIARTLLFPPASGDGRCVAILSVGPRSLIPPQLGDALGACRVIARLGPPGPAMTLALNSLDWSAPNLFAASVRADAEHMPARGDARSALTLSALRCLTRGELCEVAWNVQRPSWRQEWTRGTPDRAVIHPDVVSPNQRDAREAQLELWLERLERDAGSARFKALWRGAIQISDAFPQAVGISQSEWTRRWLLGMFDVPETTPRVEWKVGCWILLALLALFFLAGSARAPRAR